MLDHVRAVFRDGAFYPVTPCAVPENSEVDLTVRPTGVQGPLEKDPEKRKRILKALTERMKQRTLAPDAPRFTRDELHERR
jgi:hypothetical protein